MLNSHEAICRYLCSKFSKEEPGIFAILLFNKNYEFITFERLDRNKDNQHISHTEWLMQAARNRVLKYNAAYVVLAQNRPPREMEDVFADVLRAAGLNTILGAENVGFHDYINVWGKKTFSLARVGAIVKIRLDFI